MQIIGPSVVKASYGTFCHQGKLRNLLSPLNLTVQHVHYEKPAQQMHSEDGHPIKQTGPQLGNFMFKQSRFSKFPRLCDVVLAYDYGGMAQ